MEIQIPSVVLYILHTLQKAGFEAYIVGGAVRDILLQAKDERSAPVTDFDFTTNALPEEIQALFPDSFYENTFGTVSITAEHLAEQLSLTTEQLTGIHTTIESETESLSNTLIQDEVIGKIHQSLTLPKQSALPTKTAVLAPFEITTFRSEGKYDDFRRPSEISWGKTLEEDLQRRDFTINAMAIAVDQAFLNDYIEKWLKIIKQATDNGHQASLFIPQNSYKLIDPFNGSQDLTDSVIRTVGDPTERFGEDALRMLRAIRFSVQLNMAIEDATYAAIASLHNNIQHISWERIGSEIIKMLKTDYPRESIELLNNTGLLEHIIPEVQEGKDVSQGGHHITDVWTHSLDALEMCPSKDPVVRLATLLHDVAKPRTYKLIDGQPTFYNHEIIGARMAKEIAQRLRLSKRDIERIFLLVRFHMFYYQPEHTDASIRRFMRNIGLENINDILDLREADRLGSGARKTSWRLEEMKQRMIEQLNQPFAVTDLAIDGSVLMDKLNLTPGPIIGKILNHLFELVVEDPELNTEKKLLELSREYLIKES